jgi:hypothetical protein
MLHSEIFSWLQTGTIIASPKYFHARRISLGAFLRGEPVDISQLGWSESGVMAVEVPQRIRCKVRAWMDAAI